METSDPVRPYGDKTPANDGVPTRSHPADASDPATLARVADCMQVIGRASLGDIVRSTGLDMMAVLRAADALTLDGRVTTDRGDYVQAAVAGTPAEDPRDAALGILRAAGHDMDEIVWRNECETYGYDFDHEDFREIVENLVADELVRVIYEDPLIVEERYAEDPAAWGDEWPEHPPLYEAVDM